MPRCCWQNRTMPNSTDPRDNPSLKDPELYEKLVDEGNSKQKAARISNAAAQRGRSAVGRKGGKSGDYDDWTVYSRLTKAKLIEALRDS
jgi:hypothetical protein